MAFETAPQGRNRIWQVGALCRAVADMLDARFGPVSVQGELSGFSRASSGHCYFSLKDSSGQLRCAMFRRAASLVDWSPREGDQVEVYGRLAVYEARGDLQLIVEGMRRAGQGALYEDFLRRKAELEAQGLFDPERKRVPTQHPRGIGLVTSLGAAALRDAVTALRRRAPHVPVLLVPALVQGAAAPAELVAALERLYALAQRQQQGESTPGLPQIDTILLVRGGGSLEDLWAFNDTALAHAIVASPVPVIVGVGHETDFTIADFCADLRAPTPTAAAELAAQPRRDAWLQLAHRMQRLQQLAGRQLDGHAQRLDRLGWGLARTGSLARQQRLHLHDLDLRLQQQRRQALVASQSRLDGLRSRLERAVHRQTVQGGYRARLQGLQMELATAVREQLRAEHLLLADARQHLQQAMRQRSVLEGHRLQVAEHALRLLDPTQALARGYALLQDADGHVISQRAQFRAGQQVRATVSDGSVTLVPLAHQQSLDGSDPA